MTQKFAISAVKSVSEVEPAIFEIALTLEDKTDVVLRMSVFTLHNVAQTLLPFINPADLKPLFIRQVAEQWATKECQAQAVALTPEERRRLN